MTRAANARIAGATYLFYIAAGLASLALGRSPATAAFSLLTGLAALTLGVTMYAITRDQDRDLALLALTCRIFEAVPGGDGVGAAFFAVGSLLFAWLLLRGRMIPAALARYGIFAAGLLVVLLPLQRAGLLGGPTDWGSLATWLTWFPMLIYEVALAVWLLIKGVAPPAAAAFGDDGARGETPAR